MNQFLVLVALIPAFVLAQDVQPASPNEFPVIGTVPGSFPNPEVASVECPLKNSNGNCNADLNEYKCGVFFTNLPAQQYPIRLLSNMPDVLRRPSVANSPEIKETFGEFKNIKPRSFRFPPKLREERCGQLKIYNARCSVIMDKVSKTPLDSCTKTILNDQGIDTIGNILCKHAFSFAGILDPSYRINIGYYVSLCDQPWTPVQSDVTRDISKVHSEDLCCGFINGKPTFQRCDGTPTRSTCDQK
eukprot:maker-scaffold244_size240795-snap-gene-1.34 protein:Tk02093 transcript:maker-scaffold244_size240795-snap-gene-1.34-mRNA-1 annotation:"50s ribosomal protein l1"